jgi:hypothetical protein
MNAGLHYIALGLGFVLFFVDAHRKRGNGPGAMRRGWDQFRADFLLMNAGVLAGIGMAYFLYN